MVVVVAVAVDDSGSGSSGGLPIRMMSILTTVTHNVRTQFQ